MKTNITDDIVDKTLELGEFMLKFATIYRATYLNKNFDRESDSDHTTMLAVIACALAQKFHPEYDLGKVAQYALVHDLVEVYAGDVNTIDFHNIDIKAKEKAEAEALQKIEAKFGATFPWISETIKKYELLNDPESRFIKTVDKLMPGITHYFTDNKAVDDSFDDPVAFEDSAVSRSRAMRNTYAHDQKPAMDLRDAIVSLAIKKKYEKSKNKSKHIYFVRHGESEMNVSGHFAGAVTNTPLTEKGRKQASAAGKQLKTEGIPVDIIVTSPLDRAHETARQIANEIDYDIDRIILHDDLVERHFGILEGTLFGAGPVTLEAHSTDPYAYENIENAEKIADMQARADKLFEYLHSLPYNSILIVSHGAFGRALWRSANNQPITEFGDTFENAKVIKLI